MFCERIFGPVKDINPHDAKYKGVRSREAAVDKNGELVTRSIVRRERMGHISLASPVAHIWFLRGTPSAIGLLLGMTVKNLERVAYFASYIIKKVDADKARQDAGRQRSRIRRCQRSYQGSLRKRSRKPKTPTSKLWPNARPKSSKSLARSTKSSRISSTSLEKLRLTI